jgi:hypothetical protein
MEQNKASNSSDRAAFKSLAFIYMPSFKSSNVHLILESAHRLLRLQSPFFAYSLSVVTDSWIHSSPKIRLQSFGRFCTSSLTKDRYYVRAFNQSQHWLEPSMGLYFTGQFVVLMRQVTGQSFRQNLWLQNSSVSTSITFHPLFFWHSVESCYFSTTDGIIIFSKPLAYLSSSINFECLR